MEILGVFNPLTERGQNMPIPPTPRLYTGCPSADAGDAAKIGGILPSDLYTEKPPLDEPEAAFVG